MKLVDNHQHLDSVPNYAKCLKSIYGKYAMFVAAKIGQIELVKYLIKSGEAPNVEDYRGLTPLIVAALNDHADVVEYLRDYILAGKKSQISYLK